MGRATWSILLVKLEQCSVYEDGPHMLRPYMQIPVCNVGCLLEQMCQFCCVQGVGCNREKLQIP